MSSRISIKTSSSQIGSGYNISPSNSIFHGHDDGDDVHENDYGRDHGRGRDCDHGHESENVHGHDDGDGDGQFHHLQ